MALVPQMVTSGSDEWQTPVWLFTKALLRWGPFDVDACARPENAILDDYWTDATAEDWSRARAGRIWCNPPYSRTAKRQVLDHALSHGDLDAVFLLPSRTGTSWFAAMAERATEIVFLTSRVRFSGARTGAPFPSALVRIYDAAPTPRRVTFEKWR